MASPLNLCFTVNRGDFRLSADFSVAPGEVLGVIGPNGAGKTSLLRAITGDLRIATGAISIGDRPLARRERGLAEIDVTKSRRSIGHLDQRARLFPHLTALENVSFAQRARGAARTEAHAAARDWIARVGLAGRERARPHELSGGQQQRIAIARTLAASPSALLLDEPFAALDVERAADIRSLVSAQLRELGVPTILVSHDPVDLLALADRVAVLESGTVQQLDLVGEVLGAPATPFSARFAGRVLLEGVSSETQTLQLPDSPMAELRGVGSLPSAGVWARATYDPRSVRVAPAAENGERGGELREGHYSWVDRVARVAPTHSGIVVTGGRWPQFAAEVPLSAAVSNHLAVGQWVSFELDVNDIRFVPVPVGVRR